MSYHANFVKCNYFVMPYYLKIIRCSMNSKRGIMAILSKFLGQRIKDLRKRNKLTQAQLAEKIGMETTNLCKLENGGQIPKEENIEKLAKALQVNIRDLFDFGYMKSPQTLKEELIDIINVSERPELELYYKLIMATKEC